MRQATTQTEHLKTQISKNTGLSGGRKRYQWGLAIKRSVSEGSHSIAIWGRVAGLGVGHRRCVGRSLIGHGGLNVVWLLNVNRGCLRRRVDRRLFIRDEGLESQDLQQPKVRKKHCQQVQKSGDDHADPTPRVSLDGEVAVHPALAMRLSIHDPHKERDKGAGEGDEQGGADVKCEMRRQDTRRKLQVQKVIR